VLILLISSHQMWTTTCLFDSFLQNRFMFDVLFTFRGFKSKLQLKISSNGFLVWIPWHSYEWIINNLPWLPCFKWKNIYIYLMLTIFLCNLMPFLVRWIVLHPLWYLLYITFLVKSGSPLVCFHLNITC